MGREELSGYRSTCRAACMRQVRREVRELQVRKCQRVERVGARRTCCREGERNRGDVCEDETRAPNCNDDARQALRPQRDETELTVE